MGPIKNAADTLSRRIVLKGALAGGASGGASVAAEGGGATAADVVSDADRSPGEKEDGDDKKKAQELIKKIESK